MIRVIDLPDAPKIEARLTLNQSIGLKQTDHELEAMLDKLRSETLGVPGRRWDYSFEYDPDAPEDEDDVASWLADGIDVRGEDGKPLRMLEEIDWALEVLISGGALRTVIEIERDLWQRSRANDATETRAQVARNQQFLQLGAHKRRRA